MSKKFPLFIVTLIFYWMCGYAQNNSDFEAKIISVNETSIFSFCDSIITYADECFESSVWFKIVVDYEADTLHLWSTAVQFLDSQYYADNQYWLRNSIFMIDSNTTGVFVYSDMIFEIVANNVPETTFSLTDTTMRIPRFLKNASPVFISEDIMFPQYYQCLGLISIDDKKINITQKRCTCNNSREKRKNVKRDFSKKRVKN